MDNLLPILKNRQEFQKQKDRGIFVEELFENEHSPILMYGVDKGAYVQYTPSKSKEEDIQIKQTAINNLEKINISIEVEEIQGFKVAMLAHEYAAEKILDKRFMTKLSTALNSNSIIVGIPEKGFMIAVAKGKGEANIYGAVVNQYENPQTYPISDSLFYLIDGEIEMMGGNNSPEATKDENGILEITGKNDERGKIGFVVKVGNKSEDELENQIQTAYQNIILHGMKDSKNFNGKIDFHISPEFNKLTSSLEIRIKKISEIISEKGIIQLMNALSKEEVKIRFFYGDTNLITETFDTPPVQISNKEESNKNSSKTESITRKKKSWWKFW